MTEATSAPATVVFNWQTTATPVSTFLSVPSIMAVANNSALKKRVHIDVHVKAVMNLLVTGKVALISTSA